MSKSAWITCPHCDGTLLEYPDCERCGGTGWLINPHTEKEHICSCCKAEICFLCNGTGEIIREDAGYESAIPRGVLRGQSPSGAVP